MWYEPRAAANRRVLLVKPGSIRIPRQTKFVDSNKPPYCRKMSFAASLHPGSCLSGLRMNEKAAAVSMRACMANGNLIKVIVPETIVKVTTTSMYVVFPERIQS